jgi:sialate O-acetylesterase
VVRIDLLAALRLGALLLLVQLVLTSQAAPADATSVRMPEIFTDHMVLQQRQPIVVWGWAAPGEPVEVTVGSSITTATTDPAGHWQVSLPPLIATPSPAPAIPFIVHGAHNDVSYQDVVVGEVWLASGQSNMNRPVAPDQIALAHYPDIRLLTDNDVILHQDRMDQVIGWEPCSPTTLASCGDIIGPHQERRAFSEVAYHFARALHASLQVPIGIIHASTGGTTAKDWTPTPNLAATYAYDVDHGDLRHHQGVLFETKLRAFVPYALAGVIWYQGEDDGANRSYATELSTLITAWREQWHRPELPFLMVQIAQTTYQGGMLGVWDAQSWVAAHVPHTALIPSTDLFDAGGDPRGPHRTDPATGWPMVGGADPHPPHRTVVAERLAATALGLVYGQTQSEVCAPRFDHQVITGSTIEIHFAHVGRGLSTSDVQDPTWFELSADGESFVPAQACIVGADLVSLSSPTMTQPLCARFGWHTLSRHNLIGGEGLPALPFRTSLPDTR